MAFLLSAPTEIDHLSLYQNREREILSYRQFGESENCVILIHGWMTSGLVFDTLLKEAALRDFRIIVPNLRGSGIDGLNVGPFSIEQYGRDIIDLANVLNLEKFHIAGHGMGGQVAQWLASELPTRVTSLSLICSFPACGLPLPDRVSEEFRQCGYDRDVQSSIIDRLSHEISSNEKNRLLTEAERLHPFSVALSFDAFSSTNFSHQLYRIASPSLVISTDDPLVPDELQKAAVVNRIYNARLKKIYDCGHYPQCEKPGPLSQFLKSFWTQSTPTPFHLHAI